MIRSLVIRGFRVSADKAAPSQMFLAEFSETLRKAFP